MQANANLGNITQLSEPEKLVELSRNRSQDRKIPILTSVLIF